MVKKPILTDDPMAGSADLPSPGATRPVAAPAVPDITRMAEAPIVAQDSGARDSGARDNVGRDAAGHARPQTRILGAVGGVGGAAEASSGPGSAPPVGWLVVTKGPGRGAALPLRAGMNGVGRGDGLQVQINFGDDAISREAHAYVTYDDAARGFYVTHAGKTNLVRLNGAPVLATEGLSHGDALQIGATVLRFVALCGSDFDWSQT